MTPDQATLRAAVEILRPFVSARASFSEGIRLLLIAVGTVSGSILMLSCGWTVFGSLGLLAAVVCLGFSAFHIRRGFRRRRLGL